MVAEKKAREKTKESYPKAATKKQADFCPMETDTPIIEALAIQEERQESKSGRSGEEGYKRKRPQDGSPAPSEYARSGKRPSLTPPPTPSLLPPPGMMNPADVTDQDLSQLVVFQGDKAMMLIVRMHSSTCY